MDSSVNIVNISNFLLIPCDNESVHSYYLFSYSVNTLPHLLDLSKSLCIRNANVHPDVLVCISHYIYFDTINRRPFLPDVIYKQLEVKPIVLSVKDSVYDCVKYYCAKFYNEHICDIEKDDVRTIHEDVVKSFPQCDWEGCFTHFFPPRVPSDIGIRNIHYMDLYDAFCDMGREPEFWDCLQTLRGKSYIFVLNILLYVYLVTQPWFLTLCDTKIFTLTEYVLRDCLKGYSDMCKKKDFIEKRREVSLFIENHNLFGALQPPVEGWDPVEQTRALATSSPADHGLKGSPDTSFEEIARNSLLYFARPVDVRHEIYSFRDFLLKGDWERSGASSFGRVEWSYHDQYDDTWDKKGKFKARKNFILDILHVDELAEKCYGQEDFPNNTALIKSELAKIRIAVASPLEAYLLESFVLHWSNHFYLSWEGSTLEEGPKAEFLRNMQQWRRMRSNKFVLPYDFENFDHQISTDEILCITDICHFVAELNYGSSDKPELLKASRIVSNSIRSAVLHDPPGFGEKSYKVTNGLLSGMRTTSIVGNGFNLCAYKWAQSVLNGIFGDMNWNTNVEIRGDDLRLTSDNQFLLIMTYYVYKALGFKANPSKFGLCQSRGDFLRLDCVAAEGIVGLPARTTPSVTQRKPWKAAAWIGENRLVTVCENLYNIARRLPEPVSTDGFKRPFDILTNVILSRWSGSVKISSDYLTMPRLAGGLGLGKWNLISIISHRGNKIPVAMFEELDIQLKIANSVTYNREEQYFEKYRHYDLEPQLEEIHTMINHDMLAKVASDDIPGLIDQVRFHYRRFVRGVRFRRIRKTVVKKMEGVVLGVEHLLDRLATVIPCEDSLDVLARMSQSGSKQPFKKYGYKMEEIRDRLRLGRLRKQTARQATAEIPEFMTNCAALESRLKLKRHVAIDWLTEGITLDYALEVHPNVKEPLSKIAAAYVEYLSPWIPDSDSFTVLWNLVSRRIIDAFNRSPLCQTFFSF